MTYANLAVYLRVGHSNARILKVAANLAKGFRAHVLGIGALQALELTYAGGYVSGDIMEQDRLQIETDLKKAQAEFRAAIGTAAQSLEWRSAVTFGAPADYLAGETCGADLLIIGQDPDAESFDNRRQAAAGDVAMKAGRPLLIVPAAVKSTSFDRIVIGWKDTRETRRAVADALPLLKAARQVTIAGICIGSDEGTVRSRLDDVAAWLGRHAVSARPLVRVLGPTADDAGELAAVAREKEADLLVGGAYGHSRLREWVLGGVTRDLLLRAPCCTLVSH